MEMISATEFIERAGEALASINENFRSIPKEDFACITQGKSRGSTMANYRMEIGDDGIVYGELGDVKFQLVGDSGAEIITISGFAELIRKGRPYYPKGVIEGHAKEVIDGKYDSIAPSAGTNIYFIRREGDVVIATTKPKGVNEVKKFELIA